MTNPTYEATKAKIVAKMQEQGARGASAVYSALRIQVMTARRDGEKLMDGMHSLMVIAGNALEEMIGEDEFDKVMDAADAHVYG